MASRALAFADPEVIRLLSTAFVPIAENCSYLQRQQDAEGDLFRLVAEQGHYAGRVLPSDTRQGQYAFRPDGRLLVACNVRDAPRMLTMLHGALERWAADAGPAATPDRLADAAAGAAAEVDRRYAHRMPDGGLVLRVYARDILPREGDGRTPDWRTNSVNHDHAWFTAEEARALVPAPAEPGRAADAPAALARRLARFHLLDNVRGETPMWRREDVRRAELRTTVESVDGARVRIRLNGRFLCEGDGSWAIRPFGETKGAMRRGYDSTLRGHAEWDEAAGRFTSFEAVACGPRWGGTEHNCRWDDLEPAPMGVVFELSDGTAIGDRTPPQGAGMRYWEA